MPPIIFTPAAAFELDEAFTWYEHESPCLGERFLNQIEAVTDRIRDNPRQFPIIRDGIRRALLRQFPYALYFTIDPDDSLTIIACFHGSRNPTHWLVRR